MSGGKVDSSVTELVSPGEILMDLLNREMVKDIVPAGAVVGPASDVQQSAGVISIMDGGVTRQDKYVPLLWHRAQLRSVAASLEHAERIGRHAYALLYDRRRTVVTQTSTGLKWLIHWTEPTAGPSGHFDTPETFESLLFCELLLGLTPIR